MGFFDKIKAGLKKTRDSITGQINSMLHAFTKIDEELFEELEELLVMADVGMNTATEICDTLRARVKERGITQTPPPSCTIQSPRQRHVTPMWSSVIRPDACTIRKT